MVFGFQAQKTASLAWQLMFLQNDGQTFSMSVQEAEKWGYSLTATTHRVVFRSSYKQPHTEVTMVGIHTWTPFGFVFSHDSCDSDVTRL